MKIGIALSGGGARGAAHIGVLQALTDRGFTFSMMAGTSMGAAISAFYANGYTPKNILEISTKMRPIEYLRPALSKQGLLKMKKLEHFFAAHLPENNFKCLKLPIFIAATNLTKGSTNYFSEGELIKPLLASTSMPGIFEPVIINGDAYIDGGIMNNMPVEPLVGLCDYIIASHVNPYNHHSKINTLKSVVEKSFQLAINVNTQNSLMKCNLLIEPPKLANFTVFDFDKTQEIYQIGYDYAASLKIGID